MAKYGIQYKKKDGKRWYRIGSSYYETLKSAQKDLKYEKKRAGGKKALYVYKLRKF